MKPLTGLFLGAGASFEAGMPLAWELTGEIKRWLTAEKIRELNTGWRAQGNGFSDTVIDDLISVIERQELHYEAVLGHLEVQFRRQRVLPQEYHALYPWLVELVYHLLYFRQVNNNTFLNRHLRRYDGIRALVDANTPLWVFSLNHDMIVEAIAARLSIPLHCGFSPSRITLPRRNRLGKENGEIQAEVITKHDLEHHAMYFPNPLQRGIYLLKVHGALDVFTFNEGEDLLRLLPDRSGMEGVIDVLRAANEDLFYPIPGVPGGRAKAINEIAYADQKGEMQFLRRSLLAGAFKFDPRRDQVLPKPLLRHFSQNLNFVTKLVCIGYSMGDPHINTVLREWLELSQDRHIEIVSPSIREVPSFLLHLGPQTTLTKSGATQYFDAQAGIVRSSRENLEWRLVSVARSLGRDIVGQGIASVMNRYRERMSRDFIAKLQNLPHKDGQPDFSAIGDPATVAREWASQMKLNEDELLEQLLTHFGAKQA